MRSTTGILTALAFICFLSTPAISADFDDGMNGAPGYFSLLGSGPADLSSMETQSPALPPKISLEPPMPMTGGEKWRYYLKATFELRSYAFSMAGAGIAQARDSVPEWGQGMEGFSKRFGSGFSQKVVEKSVQFGLVNLFDEDPRYFPSCRPGIIRRALHAASEEFISHKDSGGTRIGYTRFMAATTGVLVSRQWYPKADRTAGHYAGAIATSIAVAAAKNLFNEFWPDIKKRLHH
jgi:hypothetical protein